MTEPVLVLGAEPRTALCIARSLYRQGIVVDVASFSPKPMALKSRAVREFVQLPSDEGSDAQRLESLVLLIKDKGYDTVIPANDSSLGFVSAHYETLNGLTRLACPAPDVVRRVLDKDKTLEVAHSCGIAIPKSYEVANLNQLLTIREQLQFPLVAKGRSKRDIATSTFKVRYYQTFDEIVAEFKDDPTFGEANLLQEYCIGEGVGVGLIVQKGQAVAAFQHRRLKEFPSTGGVSVLAISERLNAALLESSLKLLRALEWEGIAMVEFRYDRENDRAVLMEVNGRYWGTVSLAVQCGLDLPFYQWQIAHGKTPTVPSTYQPDARWRWTSGYLQRLHDLFTQPIVESLRLKPRSRARELMDSLSELLPPVRSALGGYRDPLPAVLETAETFGKLAISDLKRIVKAIIPSRLRAHLSVFRGVDRKTGTAYLALQALRALGLRADRPSRVPKQIRSVLFLCHGNIIRSPMAEALLRQFLLESGAEGVRVLSAGVAAKSGREADRRALIVAKDFDVSLDSHRAQSLSHELLEQADVIFVMDFLNEARLLVQYPFTMPKVFLLGGLIKGTSIEIIDPYNGDLEAIRASYTDLQTRIRGFAKLITQHTLQNPNQTKTEITSS